MNKNKIEVNFDLGYDKSNQNRSIRSSGLKVSRKNSMSQEKKIFEQNHSEFKISRSKIFTESPQKKDIRKISPSKIFNHREYSFSPVQKEDSIKQFKITEDISQYIILRNPKIRDQIEPFVYQEYYTRLEQYHLIEKISLINYSKEYQRIKMIIQNKKNNEQQIKNKSINIKNDKIKTESNDKIKNDGKKNQIIQSENNQKNQKDGQNYGNIQSENQQQKQQYDYTNKKIESIQSNYNDGNFQNEIEIQNDENNKIDSYYSNIKKNDEAQKMYDSDEFLELMDSQQFEKLLEQAQSINNSQKNFQKSNLPLYSRLPTESIDYAAVQDEMDQQEEYILERIERQNIINQEQEEILKLKFSTGELKFSKPVTEADKILNKDQFLVSQQSLFSTLYKY